MSKRRQESLKPVKPVQRRKRRVSKEPVLPQDLSADACPSDVRPEKVAKAKELIARSDYPRKKIIQVIAEKLARSL